MSVIATLSDGTARVVPLGGARTVAELVDVVHGALGLELPVAAYEVRLGGSGDGDGEDAAGRMAWALEDVGVVGCEERVALRVRAAHVAREALRGEGIATADEAGEALREAVEGGDVERVRRIAAADIIDHLLPHVRSAVGRGCFEAAAAIVAAGGDGLTEGELNELLGVTCGGPEADGFTEVVDALLAKGAEINGRAPACGAAALHVAARHGRAGAVAYLLRRGANVDARSATGNTPLMEACEYGHCDVAAMLFANGAEVNAVNDLGGTALRKASCTGNTRLVGLLLQHHADMDTANGRALTALHQASFAGHVGVVELLLGHGSDVNARAEDGRTALHNTCVKDCDKTARVLLEHGVDVSLEDNIGDTALALARKYKAVKVARLLEPKVDPEGVRV